MSAPLINLYIYVGGHKAPVPHHKCVRAPRLVKTVETFHLPLP